ncbi:hypothetical protein [Streptomyces cinereoruber]|uniref:hypothetical protein n=1 Tax=Streptomyces cinereoruber TaxID=67260 RepID=UPI00362C79E8
MSKPFALTAGALRELLANPAIDDATPVVIQADILEGDFVSVLKLEFVGTDWTAGAGQRQATRVVLGAGLGDGTTIRKPALHRF